MLNATLTRSTRSTRVGAGNPLAVRNLLDSPLLQAVMNNDISDLMVADRFDADGITNMALLFPVTSIETYRSAPKTRFSVRRLLARAA
jgi:hypothetical protein